MAKFPDKPLGDSLNLQRQLLEGIDEAALLETELFQQFWETQETISNLDLIRNIRQKFTDPYLRLGTLLLRIVEFQPFAPVAMVERFNKTIENGQAAIHAGKASLQEIRRDWNL